MTKKTKTLPIMLDRMQQALQKHGFTATRSQALAITAQAFGYRNANAMTAVAQAGGMAIPKAKVHPTRTVDLGRLGSLTIGIDPTNGEAFGIDTNRIRQLQSDRRGAALMTTPAGTLVDASSLTGTVAADDRHHDSLDQAQGQALRQPPFGLEAIATLRAALHRYQSANCGDPAQRTDAEHNLATGMTNGATEVCSLDHAGIAALQDVLTRMASACPAPNQTGHSLDSDKPELRQEPAEDADMTCPAVAYSDDRRVTARFDAVHWLREAATDDIVGLACCGWGGDYDADKVAEDEQDRYDNSRLSKMFDYIGIMQRSRDPVGFECRVDASHAMTFLAAERRSVYDAVLLQMNDD